MFGNVVVGVNEGEGGLDAIALAHDLLAASGELLLAHVIPEDITPLRESDGGFQAARRQRARELLEQVRGQRADDVGMIVVTSTSVRAGLHNLAALNRADLLVVGCSDRGPIGRVLLGDDARDAVSRAPCAVAVAPAGYAQRRPALEKIGVGYDGSTVSLHALSVARGLAAERGAPLSAFEAVRLPLDGRGTGAAHPELVEEARRRLAELGDVESRVAYGEAAAGLAEFTASVDLLVVGSHHRGPIGRLIHGSTSRRLAHTARCPLLIIPGSDTAASGELQSRGHTKGRPETK